MPGQDFGRTRRKSGLVPESALDVFARETKVERLGVLPDLPTARLADQRQADITEDVHVVLGLQSAREHPKRLLEVVDERVEDHLKPELVLVRQRLELENTLLPDPWLSGDSNAAIRRLLHRLVERHVLLPAGTEAIRSMA